VTIKKNTPDEGVRLVLTYTLQDGQHKGKTIDEWKNCDPKASERDKSWLKSRLKSLGVPESKMGEIDPGDLKGIEVRITKKRNGEYENVTNVVLGHSGGAATSTDALEGNSTPAPVSAGVEALL
jgi:hypothetical protein